nr:uncharacterized protein At4g14342 isoform X1 [Malus domestica]
MQASDRFNINSQLEHLQAKYVGTGHADMNRYEWAVNIQRDSYASYVGHYPMLAYFALAENESIGRERYNFMQLVEAYLTLWRSSEGCLEALKAASERSVKVLAVERATRDESYRSKTVWTGRSLR